MLLACVLLNPVPAFADEIGRETEAPTDFTGETVEVRGWIQGHKKTGRKPQKQKSYTYFILQICKKRGILGKCIKTERRTAENDNDIALKYFKDPTDLVKKKDLAARTAEETEGNLLIQKLKQQSEDNREKNDLIVQQKTFMNDKVSVVYTFRAMVSAQTLL